MDKQLRIRTDLIDLLLFISLVFDFHQKITFKKI